MKKGLLQGQLINRVRQLCHQDERISASLMYGSFAKGEGDEFSDIEFSIFINNNDYDGFSGEDWVGQIAPLALYFLNGVGQARVIFENFVRGEFSFKKASEISSIRAIKALMGIPWPAVIVMVDRTGSVQDHLDFLSSKEGLPMTRETIIKLCREFIYFMLSSFDRLARGERAYALDSLGNLQGYLLRLLRQHEGKIQQSETRPFRKLEKDLLESEYDRYIECTASLHKASLEQAYWATWSWGKELINALARRYETDTHEALIQALDLHFACILDRSRLEPVSS
jgi:lincosamide nucleotidyltransferase B/F